MSYSGPVFPRDAGVGCEYYPPAGGSASTLPPDAAETAKVLKRKIPLGFQLPKAKPKRRA